MLKDGLLAERRPLLLVSGTSIDAHKSGEDGAADRNSVAD
jgi:hypothetical protein